MRRFLTYVLAFLLSAASLCARQLDSLTQASLRNKVKEYFGALQHEDLEVQKNEADFMIEVSSDTLIRQFIASEIYDHYIDSPVMGAENVAVHIFDRWFSDGTLKMDSDMDFINAKMFAEFNRQSLIGMKASPLVMEGMDGSLVELFTPSDKGGSYRILFFYDTGCAKCKVESILLRNMLAVGSFPVEFYAVYSGDDRQAWESYVQERFPESDMIHIWDPSMASDFQRKYGVIQTPRLFLVSPDGVIIGRGLDSAALSTMLHGIFDEVNLEYGGDESVELFDKVFLEGGEEPVENDVRRIADYIEDTALAAGDTVMFRQLTGDLLYYLSAQKGEAFKEGASYLINEKILSRGDIWRTQDDSLKVIGLAQFMDGLLDKAVPGSRIADVKVPAVQLKSGKDKAGVFRMTNLRGKRNIILFFAEGCHVCDAEKKAARELSENDRNVRVMMVNVDQIVASDPALASRLFDSFDLSTLPYIIETDRKGIILRRYITLQ